MDQQTHMFKSHLQHEAARSELGSETRALWGERPENALNPQGAAPSLSTVCQLTIWDLSSYSRTKDQAKFKRGPLSLTNAPETK